MDYISRDLFENMGGGMSVSSLSSYDSPAKGKPIRAKYPPKTDVPKVEEDEDEEDGEELES